ncbi:MAG: Rrf2 family transcriptional regulator [Rhodocyclaceae bacterium]|nr:MAG: Rrf2 family transcriptional regulator [Rhodocyclaceae bacterium]
MRLTTKGRLAVTALVDLATRPGDAPVTLKTIGARRNISVSYLEQLFGKLRRHKIVKATRGPGGGYSLAAIGAEISIASIIRAVDESPVVAKRSCRGGSRDQMPRCIDELWFGLNEAMYAHVSGISLQHLVDQHLLEEKRR